MTRPSDAPAPASTGAGAAPLRLGFARGVAPNKWARRWAQARPDRPLELVPVGVAYGRAAVAGAAASGSAATGSATTGSATSGSAVTPENLAVDVMLERTLPGARPAGVEEPSARHAVRLYTEQIALVVSADHELAAETSLDAADLDLIPLLDHPDHAPDWPGAQPWDDPSHRPSDLSGALELVAAGVGAILLPLPLARHLTRKREHAIVSLVGATLPEGTGVWATWSIDRDDADVQQLAGVLRGRTVRSGRSGAAPRSVGAAEQRGGAGQRSSSADASGSAETSTSAETRSKGQGRAKQPPKLKPNSRGAQLAAAREKAERRRAAQKGKKGGKGSRGRR